MHDLVHLALYCSNTDSYFKVPEMQQQFSYAQFNTFLLSEMPPLRASYLCRQDINYSEKHLILYPAIHQITWEKPMSNLCPIIDHLQPFPYASRRANSGKLVTAKSPSVNC